MSYPSRRYIPVKAIFTALALYLLVLLCSSFGSAAAVAAARAETASLFTSVNGSDSGDLDREPWIVRQRPVEIDRSLFYARDGDPASIATSLELHLFDDVVFLAELDYTVANASGSISWVGHLPGYPLSNVILVEKGGIMVGSIRNGAAVYELGYGGDGRHTISEIDVTALPGEPPMEPVTISQAEIDAHEAAAPPALEDGSIVDILVVWTPNARSGAGGTTAIQNWIDLGITETNQSYDISGIDFNLFLVHMEEVAYSDSGSLSSDRNRLQNPVDGYMDSVHALRDQYKADVVTLIVESPGCGIAYIMNPVSTAFEAFAFNVTMRACISPNYTFAHEIGHLQSARHDWFVDPTNNSPYTYNHGYVHPGNQWRSIMAYSNACGGCQRQLFWSNPDRNHPVTGTPTGIPEGQPLAADNRKTLNNTAQTVANFRVRFTERYYVPLALSD